MTLKKHIISYFINKNKPKETKKENPKEEIKEPKPPLDCLGIKEQELEFEESRHMLQTDLFHTKEEQPDYFPQFEHLLQKERPKRPKSVTQSLRRRLSFSGRSLKRAISTPDLFKRNNDDTPFLP